MNYFRKELGGKCRICGYSKCMAALHFHHKKGCEKKFHISQKVGFMKIDNLKKEIDKCILLCSNCHAELTWPNKK